MSGVATGWENAMLSLHGRAALAREAATARRKPLIPSYGKGVP